MKNRSIIISRLCMLAALVLSAHACQKDYEMVDPPMMGYDDDLDEEIIMQDGLTEYFVTQFGEGDMDGSSWENAMDATGFRELVTGTTNLSNSTIYLSQGKYLMAEESGLGMIIRKDVKAIKGGYSQLSEGTDVSNRDIAAFTTVFSGDVNGNKKADSGDCGLIHVLKGHILLEGITFQYGYMSEAYSATTNCGSGIYVNGDASNAIAELSDCVIRDCRSDVTTAVRQGGPAVFVLSGQARLNNVKVLDNFSRGRGGALRLNGQTAAMFLNGCLITGNGHNGDWGTGIQLSDGDICMNNCTLFNNSGKGGALNGGGGMMLTNNTIIGNGSDTHGAIRCESNDKKDTKFINNLLFTESATAPSFNLNGSGKVAISKGYNIYQRVSNITMASTDTQYGSPIDGSLTDGVYVWDISRISNVKGYATRQEVIETARSFNPVEYPISNLGEVFVQWCGEDAFGVDGRGITRNAAKMQPGAYDSILN